MLDLTPSQLQQIKSLGIDLTPPKKPLLPILSISGITLLSFGGIFLLKSALSNPAPYGRTDVSAPIHNPAQGPTQVPKSIQHFLLTSQQYFTQALQAQSCTGSPGGCPSAIESLNQSLTAASDAIKEFPDDYRGYEQRGRIYQSLLDSQPQLLANAIADFSAAVGRNPNSADLTRNLATLYARKGDAQSTLTYLTATINLDPTTAQNFYDLAHIQQQIGLIPEALATYDRLLTIVSDPAQKQAVAVEESALEKLVSQNKSPVQTNSITNSPSIPPINSSPLIQANAGTGLIIAAPQTSTDITVSNLSTSNSLAGDSTLPAEGTQITLTNSSLTPSAQIYLTVVSGPKNINLRLLSRSGTNFTVGLDSPAATDVKFKWWIVK